MVFCNVMSCSLVHRYHQFKGNCSLWLPHKPWYLPAYQMTGHHVLKIVLISFCDIFLVLFSYSLKTLCFNCLLINYKCIFCLPYTSVHVYKYWYFLQWLLISCVFEISSVCRSCVAHTVGQYKVAVCERSVSVRYSI